MPRKNTPQHAGLKEVAAATGVSLMTVSRALRGLDGVSDAKRAKILQVARKLNYLPNSNARSLAVTNSNLIGICLPNLYNDVFADILVSMRDVFRRAGYATVIETTEYDPQAEYDWVERLLSWRPAAVVLTGHDHLPETVSALRGAKIPTLEIWDVSGDPIDIAVGLDHEATGRALGTHVAGLGYKRPAYVGAIRGYDPRADARLRGLRDAFAHRLDPAEWIVSRVDAGNSFSSGAEGTRRLLSGGAAPDVIFYLNDQFAFGGLMTCGEFDLNVPSDIGLVGFNAVDLTCVLKPELTTSASPRREIGGTGARQLLARLNGLPAAPPIVLDARNIEGATPQAQPA